MVSQTIKDYRQTTENPTLEGWKEYHKKLKNIKGIDAGAQKNWEECKKMQEAIANINETVIKAWLENLVYNKTFAGLQAQDMVLEDICNRISQERKQQFTYKNGDSIDEGLKIDGYIISPEKKMCGLQIKSKSYQSQNVIESTANVPYVYYKLGKNGLSYKFDLERIEFKNPEYYEELRKNSQK